MTEFALRLLEQFGYLGVVFLMALENIIPPIPSELIMGLGGIAVAQGRMDFTLLIVAGTVGSTLGNWVWYGIGRGYGVDRLRPIVDRWGRWLTMRWSDVERLDRFFERHGHWLVFVFRFAPVMRTMISLPAGLARMSQLKFLAWTAAGTTIWNIFLAGAGWWLGTRFREAEAWIGPAALVLGVLLLGWYGWRVATWKR